MLIAKFFKIMWHDRKTGAFRIVAKSYARYRRFGYKDMRRKLEREYFALYPGTDQRRDAQRRYRQWRKRHEKDILREAVPLNETQFSILVNIDDTPLPWLRTMIQSVQQQRYGKWELWLCSSSEVDDETLKFLRRKTKQDRRVNLKIVEKEGQVSLFNEALSEGGGEYILQLGASDRLAPHALLELAKILQRKPSVRFLYSDEDRIDEKGQRYAPYFKSDWNPDLFLSHNYIGALWCLDRDLITEIGGFLDNCDDAAQYHLLLRAMQVCEDSQIAHCSKILYHRRVPRSDRRIFPSKMTSEAACRVVEQIFSDRSDLSVEPGLLEGSCRVRFPISEPTPLVSILVPTRDRYDLLHRCIDSILEKTRYPRYEVIIIDNQSSDAETLEYMQKISERYPHIRILPYDHPFNYSAINNYAASHADGEILVLLNNDVEIISEHWLEELVQHALRPEIGAVGAMLYYDNLTVQHAGVILGLGEVAGHGHKYFPRESPGYFGRLKMVQNYSAVTGACLAVKKELYQEVGGLEEKHLTVAFNDVDFCLKLRERGYRNLWTPYAELFHHESKSRGVDNTEEKQKRFEREVRYMQQRWGRRLEKDPYYNRHLSRFFEDFRIEVYWEQRRRLRKKHS